MRLRQKNTHGEETHTAYDAKVPPRMFAHAERANRLSVSRIFSLRKVIAQLNPWATCNEDPLRQSLHRRPGRRRPVAALDDFWMQIAPSREGLSTEVVPQLRRSPLAIWIVAIIPGPRTGSAPTCSMAFFFRSPRNLGLVRREDVLDAGDPRFSSRPHGRSC